MKLDKAFHKKIKRMNREEMKAMLESQFRAGVESSNNADFRIKLHQVLEETKGIGPVTYKNIMEKAKELE